MAPVPAALEEAVARALTMLAADPTLLLSLPVVLASNENALVLGALRREAAALGVEAELGMMLDLTAQLSGSVAFSDAARTCPKVEGEPRYLDTHSSRLQREAADQRTPPVLARWGFKANTSEASFRRFFEKHHG